MPLFIPRAVEVEAIRWTGRNLEEMKTFSNDKVRKYNVVEGRLLVDIMYHDRPLRIGDWLIKNKRGTLSICKGADFDGMWRPAEEVLDLGTQTAENAL